VTSYRIPNTYQNPIAGALSNMMSAIASMPGPEERALKQAQLDQIQSTAALNRQKIADANREAAAGGQIADVWKRVLTPVEQPRTGDVPVGPLPEVPVDQRFQQALPDLVRALPPAQFKDLGSLALAIGANTPGTSDQLLTRAGLGDKVAYNSTPIGAAQERDRKMEVEDNKNIRFDKSQRYAADRQAQAAQYAADRQATSAENRPQLFADPNSPTGISIWAPGSGAHLKPGVPPQAASSLATKATGQLDAMKIFESNLADFENLAEKNPNSMGITGDMARMGSGVASQVGSAASALGIDITPVIQKGRQALTAAGIQVPDATAASQLDTYGVLIPRLAAKAFGESTGAGFSNQDAARYAKAFGESPIANIQDLRARIGVVKQMLANDVAVLGARAGGNAGQGIGTTLMAPPPAAAPTPSAPPITTGAQPVVKYGRDPSTGRPIRLGP